MIKEENIERLSDEQRKEILEREKSRVHKKYENCKDKFEKIGIGFAYDEEYLKGLNFAIDLLETPATPTDSMDLNKLESAEYRVDSKDTGNAPTGQSKYYPPSTPKQTHPMTAIEIAQFIAKNGYVLCFIDEVGDVVYNAFLNSHNPINRYRYLKPDSDKLYEFEEVK